MVNKKYFALSVAEILHEVLPGDSSYIPTTRKWPADTGSDYLQCRARVDRHRSGAQAPDTPTAQAGLHAY
jgi:hypothetical protein